MALPPSGTAILQASDRMRELAVRTGAIDSGRKLLRQNLGELINRDIEPRAATIAGEPALAAVAEDLAQHDRASVELR